MKTSGLSLRLAVWLLVLFSQLISAWAVTFTNDTVISFKNTNYDGADIVVTNCTVTVDGAHAFASLQVLSGGFVTHSFTTNGLLVNGFSVTNETQFLTGTIAQALNNSNVVTSTIVVTDDTGAITYSNTVDYVVGTSIFGVTGVQRTDNSTIPDGTNVLVSYDVLNPPVQTGVKLTVAGDVSVELGGAINVDAKGYGAGAGIGKGLASGSPANGSGGGYGGYGGLSASNALGGTMYGSMAQPIEKGSGGGAGSGGVGGVGGGAVKLTVGGALRVDGSISAKGANGINDRSGGGSGGSILITAQTFSGAGVISADGGLGEPSLGGGGGGGCIAIYFATNIFSGSLVARGGKGWMSGGAGTIYTKGTNDTAGQLVADNGGRAGTNTALIATGLPNVVVKGGAVMALINYQTIGSLLVASNSSVNMSVYSLNVSNSATIQAGGGIIADGNGYSGGQGFGAGAGKFLTSVNAGGGGAYGGYGGNGTLGGASSAGGIGYGSIIGPVDRGSGGGVSPSFPASSAGGGVVRLIVIGVLTVDGRISADGNNGISQGAGGGAGGSVWLTADRLSGSGIISANGGMGNNYGGGGGGGRVAAYFETSDFTGSLRAWGGAGGSNHGGAGTIYTKANQGLAQLVVDNGGRLGTNTILGSTGAGFDLTTRGGAVLALSSALSVSNLFIGSNSWVLNTSFSSLPLTINGSATIQGAGGIRADGVGYPNGQGPGGGKNTTYPYYSGGGGGYGGFGAPNLIGAQGGGPYGSLTQPTDNGSGGGSNFSGQGGYGGGVLRMNVTGTLTLDGIISADGGNGTTNNSGGGSGGSIWLTVSRGFSGSGTISSSGGFGSDIINGGGGGGGRIAIYCETNGFTGIVKAWGAGGGFKSGGAGTVYIKAANQSSGQVVVDNAGQFGTNTSIGIITGSTPVDLTVRGGAMTMASTLTVGNLLIATNSSLILTSAASLTVTGSCVIQAGGNLNADGWGYAAGQGPGAGQGYLYASGGFGGGGYGGSGAPCIGVAAGGGTYGFLTAPTDPGSGGGGAYSTTGIVGGSGGGGIRLTVTGSLVLDGRISADGAKGAVTNNGSALLNNGGGSGGSLWLTVGGISGSGMISANGGEGVGTGGGGGGGRIALYYQSNSFLGTIKAYGAGSGANFGGAGTIYTKETSQPLGEVVVNNNGRSGAGTTLGNPGNPLLDLTLKDGAVLNLLFSPSIHNLSISSNAWMVVSNQAQLLLTGDATIQAGGGLSANGTGPVGSSGTGAGKTLVSSYGNTGSGGGHGGFGAASGGGAAGGNIYGSMISPASTGSGGGAGTGSASTNAGGPGGGVIRLVTPGLLTLDGKISADGGAGMGEGSGGGSGGSVWLTAGRLSGSGTISASGGSGSGTGIGGGGGGGGGRIALNYVTSTFTGNVFAYGGSGAACGGAGTVYSKANSQDVGSVLVDNAGQFGTNTPVETMGPFDLAVRGGAVVYPVGTYLVLSNLFVGAGSSLTCLKSQTNLNVAVLRNATVEAGGAVVVDGKGFAFVTGPGAGHGDSTISGGSGGGYGGKGGASAAYAGGTTYGSAQQPVALGSAGGGLVIQSAGSEGGGAIRLAVGGTLSVDGQISANGNPAIQNDGGGGSGGSIWVTAGAFAGNGSIKAEGGAGELYDGSGGGGGRIAVYSPSNSFGGLISVFGAEGFNWGEDGTIYFAANLGSLSVLAHTPTSVVNNGVTSVSFTFNAAVNLGSFSPSDVIITRPDATLAAVTSITSLGVSTFRANFAQQTLAGNYTVSVGPQVEDVFGQAMAQAYSGVFTISLPVIQGTVTDTNGQPMADVLMTPTGGLSLTTTDTNGNYVLGILPGWSGTITASKSGLQFVPSLRSYSNVGASISNQNYLAASGVAPSVTAGLQATNLALNWYGTSGVNYQAQFSTNLVNWLSYGNVIPGTNGAVQVLIPTDIDPKKFFRVIATY